MSGGHFDYSQFHIESIADSIESVVRINGKTRTELHEADPEEKGDLSSADIDWWPPTGPTGWYSSFYNTDSPVERNRMIEEHNREKIYDYSPETIKTFKNGIEVLRKAYVYARRIDWLLSGDDGEDNFQTRLKEELDALKKKRR